MNITHGLRRALQVKSCGTAAIFEGRRGTWQEVGNRVSRFAGALRAHPRGRGRRVVVLMLNQDRYIECYLTASWAAGGVIVPLNIRWSIQESADALSGCRAKLLIAAALSKEPTCRRVVFETGRMAPMLYHGLVEHGVPVVCVMSRQAYQALKGLATHKTDRNDARGLAHLARTGFFKPVHVKSLPAHAIRSLIIARKKLVGQRVTLENRSVGLSGNAEVRSSGSSRRVYRALDTTRLTRNGSSASHRVTTASRHKQTKNKSGFWHLGQVVATRSMSRGDPNGVNTAG
jgi:hypothetical protein